MSWSLGAWARARPCGSVGAPGVGGRAGTRRRGGSGGGVDEQGDREPEGRGCSLGNFPDLPRWSPAVPRGPQSWGWGPGPVRQPGVWGDAADGAQGGPPGMRRLLSSPSRAWFLHRGPPLAPPFPCCPDVGVQPSGVPEAVATGRGSPGASLGAAADTHTPPGAVPSPGSPLSPGSGGGGAQGRVGRLAEPVGPGQSVGRTQPRPPAHRPRGQGCPRGEAGP